MFEHKFRMDDKWNGQRSVKWNGKKKIYRLIMDMALSNPIRMVTAWNAVKKLIEHHNSLRTDDFEVFVKKKKNNSIRFALNFGCLFRS